MAVTFRMHLNDTGYSSAVTNAIIDLGSELAANVPSTGANLGQITLDSSGSCSINTARPDIAALLAALMPANTVQPTNLGNINPVGLDVFTPTTLAVALNNISFSGATVQRDI